MPHSHMVQRHTPMGRYGSSCHGCPCYCVTWGVANSDVTHGCSASLTNLPKVVGVIYLSVSDSEPWLTTLAHVRWFGIVRGFIRRAIPTPLCTTRRKW